MTYRPVYLQSNIYPQILSQTFGLYSRDGCNNIDEKLKSIYYNKVPIGEFGRPFNNNRV